MFFRIVDTYDQMPVKIMKLLRAAFTVRRKLNESDSDFITRALDTPAGTDPQHTPFPLNSWVGLSGANAFGTSAENLASFTDLTGNEPIWVVKPKDFETNGANLEIIFDVDPAVGSANFTAVPTSSTDTLYVFSKTKNFRANKNKYLSTADTANEDFADYSTINEEWKVFKFTRNTTTNDITLTVYHVPTKEVILMTQSGKQEFTDPYHVLKNLKFWNPNNTTVIWKHPILDNTGPTDDPETSANPILETFTSEKWQFDIHLGFDHAAFFQAVYNQTSANSKLGRAFYNGVFELSGNKVPSLERSAKLPLVFINNSNLHLFTANLRQYDQIPLSRDDDFDGIYVAITNPGSGYTSAPTVSFSGGTGTAATATAVRGTELRVTVSAQGTGYTSVPTVAITGGTVAAGGVAAQAVATISAGKVTAITITNQGNYSVLPTGVTISGGGGTGATATIAQTGIVAAIKMTSTGNYSVIPTTVTLTGGGGTGATAEVRSLNEMGINATMLMPEFLSAKKRPSKSIAIPTASITAGTKSSNAFPVTITLNPSYGITDLRNFVSVGQTIALETVEPVRYVGQYTVSAVTASNVTVQIPEALASEASLPAVTKQGTFRVQLNRTVNYVDRFIVWGEDLSWGQRVGIFYRTEVKA